MYARFLPPLTASGHSLWPYGLVPRCSVVGLAARHDVDRHLRGDGPGPRGRAEFATGIRHRHAGADGRPASGSDGAATAVAVVGAALIVASPATMTTPTMLFALVGMTTATLLHWRTANVESATAPSIDMIDTDGATDDPPLRRAS